jgi:hypothetical protein
LKHNGLVIAKFVAIGVCIGMFGLILLPGYASALVVNSTERGSLQTYYTTVTGTGTVSGNSVTVQIDVFKSTYGSTQRMVYMASVLMDCMTGYHPNWAASKVDAVACRLTWTNPTSAGSSVNILYGTPYTNQNGTAVNSMLYIGAQYNDGYQSGSTAAGSTYARISMLLSDHTRCLQSYSSSIARSVEYRIYDNSIGDTTFYSGCVVEKYTPATQNIYFQAQCYFRYPGNPAVSVSVPVSVTYTC